MEKTAADLKKAGAGDEARVRHLWLVAHGFPPYYGGAEHAAGELAAAAAASGRWKVTVLASDIGGRLPAREVWKGCNVFRVHAAKKAWTGHTVMELISFLRAAWGWRGGKEVERPDFIIGNCAIPGGAVAGHLARRWRVPYGVILHGSDVPGHQVSRFGAIYAAVRPWVRRIWKRAAWVVAVSRPLRELATQTWPVGTIDVISNGVDVEQFHPAVAAAGEETVIRTEPEFVTVAQWIEGKGIQYLLEAMARGAGRGHLTLYGSGPFGETLKAQVQTLGLGARVTFAGLIPNEELAGVLRRADGFVLPSLHEGLPLSILEAMASGLPVLTTRVGGIPDLIVDGQNGLLIPPADVTALAAAWDRLTTDAPLRARLGVAARRTADACSWEKIWEQYESLIFRNVRPGAKA